MRLTLEAAAATAILAGVLSVAVVPMVGASLVAAGAYALVLPKFIEPQNPAAR